MRKGDKRTGLEIRRSIYLVGIFGFSPVIVVSAYRMGESAWVDLAQENTYPGIYANRRCYHVLFSICSQFSRLIFLRLRVFERYVIDSARLSSGTLARCFWSESPRFSVHILCVRYYPRLLSNSRLIYWQSYCVKELKRPCIHLSCYPRNYFVNAWLVPLFLSPFSCLLLLFPPPLPLPSPSLFPPSRPFPSPPHPPLPSSREWDIYTRFGAGFLKACCLLSCVHSVFIFCLHNSSFNSPHPDSPLVLCPRPPVSFPLSSWPNSGFHLD